MRERKDPTKEPSITYTNVLSLQCHLNVHTEKLHRKEVIQPHLPIRLPCYDFTPIIYPTFGG
jgi:hypothetical protein